MMPFWSIIELILLCGIVCTAILYKPKRKPLVFLDYSHDEASRIIDERISLGLPSYAESYRGDMEAVKTLQSKLTAALQRDKAAKGFEKDKQELGIGRPPMTPSEYVTRPNRRNDCDCEWKIGIYNFEEGTTLWIIEDVAEGYARLIVEAVNQHAALVKLRDAVEEFAHGEPCECTSYQTMLKALATAYPEEKK